MNIIIISKLTIMKNLEVLKNNRKFNLNEKISKI